MMKKKRVVKVECPFCSTVVEEEHIIECSACYREGCYACIPGGMNTICPECEARLDEIEY